MADESKKRGVRRTFLTGLIIILPVWVTYSVVKLIFRGVSESITPFIFKIVALVGSSQWLETAWVSFFAPVVSLTVAVFTIYVLGIVGGNVIGRQVLRGIEALLLRVPLVRGIYSATRQFLDAFSPSDGRAFSGVVLVEFPRPGTYALGLVTSETQGEVQARTQRKVVSVFVPTTPNPTGGYVLFVPEDELVRLEMTVDDALKMVISGGVLTPPFTPRTASQAG